MGRSGIVSLVLVLACAACEPAPVAEPSPTPGERRAESTATSAPTPAPTPWPTAFERVRHASENLLVVSAQVGRDNEVLLRRSDHTWSEITPPITEVAIAHGSPIEPSYSITDVATVDGETIWTIVASASRAGLFRSSDGGRSWSLVSTLSLPAKHAGDDHALQFIDGVNGFLYKQSRVTTTKDVLRTRDGGATWSDAGADPPSYARPWFLDIDIGWQGADGSIGGADLAETRDGGLTWTRRAIANDVDCPAGSRTVYDVPDTAGTRRLAMPVLVDCGDRATVAILTSTDRGRTWEQASAIAFDSIELDGQAWLTEGTRRAFTSATAWWLRGPTVDGQTDIHRSDDAGQTWSKLLAPTADGTLFGIDAQHAIWQGQEGPSLCCKIYETTDGGRTWSEVSTVSPKTWPDGLAV